MKKSSKTIERIDRALHRRQFISRTSGVVGALLVGLLLPRPVKACCPVSNFPCEFVQKRCCCLCTDPAECEGLEEAVDEWDWCCEDWTICKYQLCTEYLAIQGCHHTSCDDECIVCSSVHLLPGAPIVPGCTLH